MSRSSTHRISKEEKLDNKLMERILAHYRQVLNGPVSSEVNARIAIKDEVVDCLFDIFNWYAEQRIDLAFEERAESLKKENKKMVTVKMSDDDLKKSGLVVRKIPKEVALFKAITRRSYSK